MNFRNMEITLLIDGNTLIQCSQTVIESSEVLKEMINFTHGDSDPIPLPSFVTEQLFQDIATLCENFENLSSINSNIVYLTDLMRVTDYLALCDLTKFILHVILAKISLENCFEMFKLTNNVPYFNDITRAALHLMMTQINKTYQDCQYFTTYQDPYVDRYKQMNIKELQMMIGFKNTAIVTKMFLLKNWWDHNMDLLVKENILEIVEHINSQAAYKPRSSIIFMRTLRDKILDDMQALEHGDKTHGE